MLLIIILFSISLILIIAYVRLVYRLIKKRTYFLSVAMLSLPFIAVNAVQYYWFADLISEKIGINYPVSINVEYAFRESCGAVVFKLSDDTLRMIKKDGLKFFAGATQARGYLGSSNYQYDEWKETPLPPSWTSEGSWMICSGLNYSEHSRIVAAAKSQGTYYTSMQHGQLVLIPSLGYVVYSYYS